MQSNNPFLQKYKPTCSKEVLGNNHYLQVLKIFMDQFANPANLANRKPNIVVHGPNGVGKTLMVDLILKETGFHKITPNLSNIYCFKNGKSDNYDNTNVVTYYLMLQNKCIGSNGVYSTQKVALVFDGVSSITNPKEKEAIKAIVKHNRIYKAFPIIIIGNVKHNKTMNELCKIATAPDKNIANNHKNIINELYIYPPNHFVLEKFVKRICVIEKITLIHSLDNEDEDVLTNIINHAQGDVRRLLNVLEDLKNIYQSETIDSTVFAQYCNTAKTKDIDPGIYEAAHLLLNRYEGVNSSLETYSRERSAVPLMFHENYPLNIGTQFPHMSNSDQINLIYHISQSISESDKIDGLIYSNQCWNLQPVHGFSACVYPSYFINKPAGKLHIFEKSKYRYTQDYNKTSIKKINNKAIKKAQEHPLLKRMSNYDFLYVAAILKTLFELKELPKIAQLMKAYHLTLKEIDSIIKIDKIKKIKHVLTAKQKSILKELTES